MQPARPCVFSGTDPASRAAAGRLLPFWRGPAQVFDGELDDAAAWGRLLAGMREELRQRGETPDAFRICLCSSTWTSDAAGLADALPALVAAAREATTSPVLLRLVLLLPPHAASDEERMRARGLFERLEEKIQESVPVEAVFVNWAPESLYHDPEPAGALSEALLEILRIEVADEELDALLASHRHAVQAAPLRVDGKKCVYTTAGLARLVWPRKETFDLLRCEFAMGLFEFGLMRSGRETPEDAVASLRRARDFIEDLIREWAGVPPGEVPSPVLGFQVPVTEDAAGGAVAEWEKAFQRAVAPHLSKLEARLEERAGVTGRELRSILSSSHAGLAEGLRFLRALLGTLPVPDDQGELAARYDAGEFEAACARRPTVAALERTFHEAFPEVLRLCGAPPPPLRLEDETLLSWLRRSAAAARDTFETAPLPAGRFFRAALDLAGDLAAASRLDGDSVRQAIRDLAGRFAAASKEHAGMDGKRAAEKSVEQARLESIDDRYSWFERRFRKRASYRTERRSLQRSIAEIEKDRAALRAAYDRTLNLFAALAGGVLGPLVVRARLAGAVRSEIENEYGALSRFIGEVRGVLAAAVKPEPGIPREPVREIVTTPPRMEKLRQTVAGGLSIDSHAALLLEFRPQKRSSYRDCADLGGHFETGARTLIDRIGDYATGRAGELLSYDVLDVLLTLGAEDATRALAGAARRAREFAALSPGELPRIGQAGGLRTVFVLRSGAGFCRRARAGHAAAFQEGFLETVESGTDVEAELACFVFAFPAFAVHGYERWNSTT